VTVDPYAWNERALRAWAKAGFVEVSRHDPDDEHLHPWVLMRFAPEPGSGLVMKGPAVGSRTRSVSFDREVRDVGDAGAGAGDALA
jgi:hypothetical protein